MPKIRLPAAWICLAALLPLAASAAPPALNDVAPRGMSLGQANTLTFQGANFDDTARLIFSGVEASEQKLQSASGGQAVFAVTLGEQTGPGIFAVRVATDDGVSAPIAIAVDELPQVTFAAEVPKLPVAMTGNLSGSAILDTSFTATKGQRVVVDVESRRLGAKLNPVVRILNERGTQIAWSPPQQAIGGDARCTVTIPADGRYTISLNDFLYRGAAPGHFRLKIGDLRCADFALPLGVSRGQTTDVQLVGLPGGQTAKLAVETSAEGPSLPRIACALPVGRNFTGAAPILFVSPLAEAIEGPKGDGAGQPLAASPVAVSGRLMNKGEQDRYLVPVAPGAKLRIEMIAAAIGSPMDGVIDVLRENGQRLAGNDDQNGSSDPALDFDVPGDVDKIVIAARDMLGRGGEAFVYRVVVRPRDAPDFSLAIDPSAVQIPTGGGALVTVKATRTNYAGPIKVRVHGLPDGVAVAGTEIPPGSEIALLTLAASGPAAAGVCVIEGSSVGVEPPVRRIAMQPASDLTAAQPTLAAELGWAIAKPAPIQLAWTASADERLTLGSKLTAPIKLTRSEGAAGEVRLSLLTNQTMPKKTIKKDNKDEVVDDLDRALRLEGEPVIAADQSEASLNILVPGDLSDRPWDLVVRGELLSADKQQVLATAYTSLHSLGTLCPLRLELAGAAKVEAKAGLGETGILTGAVHRAEGFAHPVKVTLAGLPEGFAAGEVTVPADKSDFALPVRFAYGAKPGELNNVKLVATAQPSPENAASLVRSNEVAVAINVVPGERPEGEQPLAIFDDDEKFVAALNQGGGQISLDEADKHSGKVSAKVTPDQRFNPSVPGLGVKIRENPAAPDEYRYLRFAWKKQGGNSICLQINHDGAWGPGGGGREGAKFRYHAGGGGECYGASLVLDEKLPAEWTVVTRDLFADFGEFTFSGIALSPVDGEAGWFDAIYLGRSPPDLELVKP